MKQTHCKELIKLKWMNFMNDCNYQSQDWLPPSDVTNETSAAVALTSVHPSFQESGTKHSAAQLLGTINLENLKCNLDFYYKDLSTLKFILHNLYARMFPKTSLTLFQSLSLKEETNYKVIGLFSFVNNMTI